MKNLALCIMITFLFSSTIIMGQQVGKMDFKDDGFTQKKFNHPEKKIFIQHFIVNYQTVMVSYASAKGGNNHGSAVAGLALGLDGVTNEQLQKMTDKYYINFVNKLTDAGFSILTVDEVKKTDFFADMDEVNGGTPSQDNFAEGYLTTLPSNFIQLDGGGGAFNLAGQPESNKLGGVIVARVYLTIPFAESQEINGGLVGGVAKITAKADLRISPNESIPAKGDFAKPKNITSAVSFAYKESLKWQALYLGKLKKPLEIEDVLDEDKKYKSTSVASSGSSFSTKYSTAYSENAILVDCDPEKYQKGVDQAVSQYLNMSLDGFIGYFE